MYTVTVRHHGKDWRNGDLEDKTETVAQINFKTKRDAKNWIESKLAGKPRRQVSRYPHTSGGYSSYYYFTGATWQHENTGEQMEEYYNYILTKTEVRRL